MNGRFVVLEGGEGSGKSTQAARLAASLGAVLTHQPGATPVGERLRALLLDPATGDLDVRAEALLMAADRAQHVRDVLRPALAAGRDVVCDRYVGSSLAYQGYGRGLPLDDVAAISRFATGGLEPDLVLLLEVPPAVAAARLQRQRDRMEEAGDGFHQRVQAGYRALAAADPERWVVVDGQEPADALAARLASLVAERFDRMGR